MTTGPGKAELKETIELLRGTDAKKRKIVACYHEAGHAVASMEMGAPVLFMELVPTGEKGAYGRCRTDDFDDELDDRERAIASAVVALVGPLAEAKKEDRLGDAPRFEVAYRLIRLVYEDNDSDPDEDTNQIFEGVRDAVYAETGGTVDESLLRKAYREVMAEAYRIVKSRWPGIKAIAKELAKRGSLNRDQIEELASTG